MVDLRPDELRQYARRNWNQLDDLDRVRRARQPASVKARIGEELYLAAKAARPSWPSDEDRREDLAAHLRYRALLDRAAHVCAT